MADISSGTMEILDIPSALLPNQKRGLGLDIGGSLVKLAYSREVDAETVRLHFVSFPREDLQHATKFIVDNCINIDCEQPVRICGLGGHKFIEELCKDLNMKIDVVLEMDSFATGFRFLTKHLDKDIITYPSSQKAQNHANKTIMQMAESIRKMKECNIDLNLTNLDHLTNGSEHGDAESTVSDCDQPVGADLEENDTGLASGHAAAVFTSHEKTEDTWILGMIGSGALFTKISSDGAFEFVDLVSRAGKTFLGLGSLLTGAKSYEELILLASQGDKDNIDTKGKHVKGQGTDIYSATADELLLYSFGQTAFKPLDSLSRADLAAACLGIVCEDTVQCLHNAAALHQPRAVYVCGSFTGLSQTVRTEMETAFLIRNAFNVLQYKCEIYFLKYGGYLGALGNLVKSLETAD